MNEWTRRDFCRGGSAGAIALLLSGCSLDRFRTSEARIPRLVYSSLSDPKTFNYALSAESPNIFGLTYEGLTTTNAITKEVEPAIAESWEISADSKQIVFTLRPDLKWSDGEPLTVDDVVFTYNSVFFNPDIPNNQKDGMLIGKERAFPAVTKLDERRVAFIAPEPFAPLLRSTDNALLPEHILYEATTTKGSDDRLRYLSTWGIDTPPEQIICNGPYKLESYRPGERVTFRRNPYFWRKDADGNGQPYIERIIWEIVENQDTALLQFRSGSLDLIGVTAEQFPLLKREEERGKFTIYEDGPTPSITFISFNLNRAKDTKGKPLVEPYKSEWFNNVAFRQAVAYGIDRQRMLNNIYRGIGAPQTSPIYTKSPFFLSPEENPNLRVYDYQPERAKQLLTGAGFRYNDSGELLDAVGNRVRFTLLTNAGNKVREAMGAQIQFDLSKLGIKVDFKPISFGTLVEKLDNSRDWECHLIGFGGGIEPHFAFNLWSPEGRLHLFNQGPQPGSQEIVGWQVADWERKIGDLYVQAAQALNEGTRKEIYGQAQILAMEYLPLIFLIDPLSMSAVRDRVRGIRYSATGGAMWNLYELQLQE